jgi:catechol-2,3-dioxygenase
VSATIQARRLGHATFATTDIERDIDYYQDTVGLSLAAREKGRAFLATECGQIAVVLEEGPRAACAALAFEIAPQEDCADIARRLAAQGVAADVRSDIAPGVPQAVAFADPKGTAIELFPRWEFVGGNAAVAGVRPNKLGHIAFLVTEIAPLETFYADTLGFRMSDWIEDWFLFMRCGRDHHTVNFLRGQATRVHHVAFELRDAAHMIHACDVLARQKFDILWGPTRQGPGHNVAVYHRNPAGHIVELYTDLDVMADEALDYYEPRPWHRDRPQRPKVWHGPTRQTWGLPPSPEFRADTA